MKPKPSGNQASLDPFSLAFASIAEMIEAIASKEALADEGVGVPPLAEQIANMVVAEAVRLIRLGTTSDVVDAAHRLARFLLRSSAEELERRQPDAYRVVSGAAVALDAAAAPTGAGSEEAVLRSWDEKAIEAVALVNATPGRKLPRLELLDALRSDLGKAPSSALSHMLSHLEAAGLIVRIREGRNVTVHLGPVGAEEHVQAVLRDYEQGGGAERSLKILRKTLEPLLSGDEHGFERVAAAVDGAYAMALEVAERRRHSDGLVSIERGPEGSELLCQVNIAGRTTPDLLLRARFEQGKVVAVDTYAPTRRRPQGPVPAYAARHGLWEDALESQRTGGREQRVPEMSAHEAYNNLKDRDAGAAHGREAAPLPALKASLA